MANSMAAVNEGMNTWHELISPGKERRRDRRPRARLQSAPTLDTKMSNNPNRFNAGFKGFGTSDTNDAAKKLFDARARRNKDSDDSSDDDDAKPASKPPPAKPATRTAQRPSEPPLTLAAPGP